jgi:protein-arginine kinase activator protein McsA
VGSFTITETETLVTLHCAQCHQMFAITRHFEQEMRRDRGTFYCPSGHSQWYPGDTLEQENKRLKAQITSTRDQLEAAERSRRALRGVATKAKNRLDRVENGVCPHCQRSFQNLRRHLETKHHDVKPITMPS